MDERVDIKELVRLFLEELVRNYTIPLIEYIKQNPILEKTCPGLLINFEKIIVYLGNKNIAIEYEGPYYIEELNRPIKMTLSIFDFSNIECNLLEKIIGFNYTSTNSSFIELPPSNINIILPTQLGMEKLLDLKWNFYAQNALIMINSTPTISTEQCTRIIDSYFFDAVNNSLKTRHIKWLDVFPIKISPSDEEDSNIFECDISFLKDLAKIDAKYTFDFPSDFKNKSLPIINRFIELWGNEDTSETSITKFLSRPQNQFIIKRMFGATKIYPEILCEWQNKTDKPNIKPDFFILHSTGYADIVDFKLPLIKKIIVGSPNREKFSAKLDSYIAQMRVYADYFDDSNNRLWFEKKYGFKVYHPRKYLIIGRRHNFDSDTWREILSQYINIEIINYDALIDSVIAQFYDEDE